MACVGSGLGSSSPSMSNVSHQVHASSSSSGTRFRPWTLRTAVCGRVRCSEVPSSKNGTARSPSPWRRMSKLESTPLGAPAYRNVSSVAWCARSPAGDAVGCALGSCTSGWAFMRSCTDVCVHVSTDWGTTVHVTYPCRVCGALQWAQRCGSLAHVFSGNVPGLQQIRDPLECHAANAPPHLLGISVFCPTPAVDPFEWHCNGLPRFIQARWYVVW